MSCNVGCVGLMTIEMSSLEGGISCNWAQCSEVKNLICGAC